MKKGLLSYYAILIFLGLHPNQASFENEKLSVIAYNPSLPDKFFNRLTHFKIRDCDSNVRQLFRFSGHSKRV